MSSIELRNVALRCMKLYYVVCIVIRCAMLRSIVKLSSIPEYGIASDSVLRCIVLLR